MVLRNGDSWWHWGTDEDVRVSTRAGNKMKNMLTSSDGNQNGSAPIGLDFSRCLWTPTQGVKTPTCGSSLGMKRGKEGTAEVRRYLRMPSRDGNLEGQWHMTVPYSLICWNMRVQQSLVSVCIHFRFRRVNIWILSPSPFPLCPQ